MTERPGAAVAKPNPWESFTDRLNLVVERLVPEQYFVIEARHPALEGANQVLPYAQVRRATDCYWAELSGNLFLSPDFQLTENQHRALDDSGWDVGPSGEGNWSLSAVSSEEVSERITRAVRDVFGVPHPTLLTVSNLGSFAGHVPSPDIGPLVGSLEPGVRGVIADPLPETISAIVVESHDRLSWLLEQGLTAYVGAPVASDPDGAIAVKVADVLVLIEPDLGGMPWVHLSALVADGLNTSDDLYRYVNDRTSELTATQAFVRDSALFVKTDVLGSPFLWPTIAIALELVVDAAQEIRGSVTAQFGGGNIYDEGAGGYL